VRCRRACLANGTRIEPSQITSEPEAHRPAIAAQH
jgi:hypothetical protein